MKVFLENPSKSFLRSVAAPIEILLSPPIRSRFDYTRIQIESQQAALHVHATVSK